jgi:hypothetical protein
MGHTSFFQCRLAFASGFNKALTIWKDGLGAGGKTTNFNPKVNE